jgi:hypothetical protein
MRKFAIVCGVMVLPSIVFAQQPSTSRTPQPQPFQMPQAENPTPQVQQQQQQAQPAQTQQQHQQAQPPALAHPNHGQPPQLNMDEVRAAGGGKADPNAPDQTVEPANGQPQQAPGQTMIPGGLR